MYQVMRIAVYISAVILAITTLSMENELFIIDTVNETWINSSVSCDRFLGGNKTRLAVLSTRKLIDVASSLIKGEQNGRLLDDWIGGMYAKGKWEWIDKTVILPELWCSDEDLGKLNLSRKDQPYGVILSENKKTGCLRPKLTSEMHTSICKLWNKM